MFDKYDLHSEFESEFADWVSRMMISYIIYAISPGNCRERKGHFLPHPPQFTTYKIH
jgi:hypothetical protein